MTRKKKDKKTESSRKVQQPSSMPIQISKLSLIVVPDDVVEGYEERIETGIEWTLLDKAAREHAKRCQDAKRHTFSEALERKLETCILGRPLKNSKMSPQDYYETIVNMDMWEQKKVTDRKQKICYFSKNAITNDIEKVLKKPVKVGNRKILREDFLNSSVVRINHAKITDLDWSIRQFKNLEHLILCGNYIRNLQGKYLPSHIKMLELKANRISDLYTFVDFMSECFYLGLSRNLINDESLSSFSFLSLSITIIDLGENDIYSLKLVLDTLAILPSLVSLTLAGNPCSVCAGYAVVTLRALPNLKWLDNREVLETDIHPPRVPKENPTDVHPEDLRSAWFVFKVLRILSTPQPPKTEKGTTGTFHVELEIPLLDSKRRNFLMYRDNKFLVEYPPAPEDGWSESNFKIPSMIYDPTKLENEASCDWDIYRHLEPKNSKIIHNYKIFESNKVQWNNIMMFQDPTVRIFCPDLVTLRDTFRSVITIRFVCTMSVASKPTKDKIQSSKPISEYKVTLATVKCALKTLDWSQKAQHFHWDNSMGTDEAIHWGDGDLEVLQYISHTKIQKAQKALDLSSKLQLPKNLTCHFSFGIERLV